MTVEETIQTALRIVAPFYAKNNKGHALDHAEDVIRDAVAIYETLEPGPIFDVKCAIIAAAYHDSALSLGRVGHESAAAKLVRARPCELTRALTAEQLELCACACAEHRASYKGEYTSLLSAVVSAADRGRPRSTMFLVQRLVNCFEAGRTLEESTAIALKHLTGKYGTTGYARYPGLYRDLYAAELAVQQAEVDQLTYADVLRVAEGGVL